MTYVFKLIMKLPTYLTIGTLNYVYTLDKDFGFSLFSDFFSLSISDFHILMEMGLSRLEKRKKKVSMHDSCLYVNIYIILYLKKKILVGSASATLFFSDRVSFFLRVETSSCIASIISRVVHALSSHLCILMYQSTYFLHQKPF
jgi:hypothetical protein